jgi:hypothetical protein
VTVHIIAQAATSLDQHAMCLGCRYPFSLSWLHCNSVFSPHVAACVDACAPILSPEKSHAASLCVMHLLQQCILESAAFRKDTASCFPLRVFSFTMHKCCIKRARSARGCRVCLLSTLPAPPCLASPTSSHTMSATQRGTRHSLRPGKP